MTGVYPLFYCDTTPDDNSVTVHDEDELDHYGVFVNDTLMGTWTVQKEMNTCLSSFFQLIDKNKVLITGTMILFLEYALVFDESFGIVSYPCVTVDGCLKSIQPGYAMTALHICATAKATAKNKNLIFFISALPHYFY